MTMYTVLISMCASSLSRLSLILLAFATFQVVASPGTKHKSHPFQGDEDVHAERIGKFQVYNWHVPDIDYSNCSCGVTIAGHMQSTNSKLHWIFSPFLELQGRAGAVICETSRSRFQIAFICMYLPSSGSASFFRDCDQRLFSWGQMLLDELSTSARTFWCYWMLIGFKNRMSLIVCRCWRLTKILTMPGCCFVLEFVGRLGRRQRPAIDEP